MKWTVEVMPLLARKLLHRSRRLNNCIVMMEKLILCSQKAAILIQVFSTNYLNNFQVESKNRSSTSAIFYVDGRQGQSWPSVDGFLKMRKVSRRHIYYLGCKQFKHNKSFCGHFSQQKTTSTTVRCLQCSNPRSVS